MSKTTSSEVQLKASPEQSSKPTAERSSKSRYVINDEADLLEAAAEVIEEYGWCRYTMRESDGRVCALGAMKTALAGSGPDNMAAFLTAKEEYIRGDAMRALNFYLVYEEDYRKGIPHWNDEEVFSGEQVIDTFRTVAKNVREKK